MATRKEHFKWASKANIEAYNVLITTLKEAIEVFKPFNNKVINVRLKRALDDRLEKIGINNYPKIVGVINLGDGIITLSLSSEYRSIYETDDKWNKVRFLGYINTSGISFPIVPVTGTKRLDYEKTAEGIQDTIDICMKHISEWKDAWDNYDSYLGFKERYKQAQKEYKEKVPYMLQDSYWL